MISFQRLLGQEDEFFSLLEASAVEGCKAVAALRGLFKPDAIRSLETFAAGRRRAKEIATRLEEMLVTTFVTPMEREDLESLSEALYKIPKTVEKFAERFLIVEERLNDVDFSRQLILVEQAVQLVHKMILALKEGRDLGGIKALQNELQLIESHVGDLVIHMMQAFYRPGFPALKAVILHDLFALNEKVVDRCCDVGSVLSHVVLKNS